MIVSSVGPVNPLDTPGGVDYVKSDTNTCNNLQVSRFAQLLTGGNKGSKVRVS